ncbi:ribosome maturation factor RimM [Desertifilum sp. FACHB-1129]|uniref:Ribosome maturation factor RimM n=1 Tax=Desertifilum tharense IPPAS B-1220 TaxID=1781255 RepID=A0A1E5QD25_9CYAN|nr:MULTISPECIES: ribosome maturation factor RimM [Desertifilum]MDA0213505.1 ribosome maturation factor RimM [Cyanobacteria bacterium FC1]MBD2311406.1 ribosome maturation factor RimM [Desertifilum sp. FACHB-1129]MBD2321652.1 ribosome maturation factor RimM [Desertifilum sp. FACHB-866]MBD2331779.1 ribosome maturation factor RimM [Desertifilum sp. FACHB-868]OEJ72549.1 ribosome maturation factor RimM [Desertifilum tharense IPPAS B-1220]
MNSDDWLEIGTIVAAQGLDGELRVYPSSDFPERFLEPGTRWLQRSAEAEPEPVELLEGRMIPGKGIYAIVLEGVEDRDEAEALRGARLLVPDSDRPQLAEDEYHVVDLLGLEVYHQPSGDRLGTIANIIPAGNDLLEVQLDKPLIAASPEPEPPPTPEKRQKRSKPPKPQTTVLIPFVKEIVPIVDIPNRRVEVNPPPGLLEST